MTTSELLTLYNDRYTPPGYKQVIKKHLNQRQVEPIKYCEHEFKAIIGFSNIYYNCQHCGIHRETYKGEDINHVKGTSKIIKAGLGQTSRGTTDGS
jgi:hypothetical protein